MLVRPQPVDLMKAQVSALAARRLTAIRKDR